jgi:outer membrane protein assembly factor BamB
LENSYGHATSLLTWRNRLIVQLDQGRAEAGKSRLYALDTATGEIVWQQRRIVSGSWATPIVIPAPKRAQTESTDAASGPLSHERSYDHGEQIIAMGEPWLISYAPENGQELWRWEGLGSDLAPSPIFANGLLFVVSPNQQLLAIRPDGQGDVTKTHLVWSTQENVPDITSPVTNGELLFTLSTYGVLTCFESKTGAKLWEHSFEVEFHASPAIAGERIYFISTAGDAFVVRVGREFQQLAQNKFGEPVAASPAFAGERIIVRGEKTLFCVAEVFLKPMAQADAR